MERDAIIVQDHAKIVQTCMKRVFLDDFTSEFGRLLYDVQQKIPIFAPEYKKQGK